MNRRITLELDRYIELSFEESFIGRSLLYRTAPHCPGSEIKKKVVGNSQSVEIKSCKLITQPDYVLYRV